MQILHSEGFVILRRQVEMISYPEDGGAPLGAVVEQTWKLTGDEAKALLEDKAGLLRQAVQEAKTYNRKQKLEKLAKLEQEVQALKESLK